MTSQDLSAFVLLPFEEEFDKLYSELIKPALEAAGYSVHRADTRLDQRNVMNDVVSGIVSADLLVADLTGLNPNVMYEVGMSHGLRKPTIIITQALDQLPFDLRIYRANEYSTHFSDAAALKGKLTEIASQHRAGQITWGTPVSDFAPTFSPPATPGEPASTPLSEGTAEEEPKGFVDLLADLRTADKAIGNGFGVIAAATQEVGGKIQAQSERLAKLTAGDPGPGAIRQFQRIAVSSAGALDEYCDHMEDVLPSIEEDVARFIEGGFGYANWLRENADSPGEDLAAARKPLSELLATAEQSRDEILDFRENIESLRGISQPMTRAASRTVRALDRIVKIQEDIIAHCSRTLALLGEEPSSDAPSSPDV